jgi:predicted transposase YbfD/YdcC
MNMDVVEGFEPSRLKSLLEHLGTIEDPRDPWRVAHPLNEVLFLVVCATICDCEDYDIISDWGEERIDFLRRYLPYEHGVPGGRWLTILMNRIEPALFSAAFTGWVRETWPDKPEFVAIDGKTSRRSHDRALGKAPLHLVSAYATTAGLVLGQEAVAEKSNEITAIPALLDRLGEAGGLKGATVSIDAIATNPAIAQKILDQGADYLLAVKANQPTLRAEVEAYFADAPEEVMETLIETDKGHGRIEERVITVSADANWLQSDRRFPGELRMPGVTSLIRVCSTAHTGEGRRGDTRYFIASGTPDARTAAHAVRGHWLIENALHWVLDVVFKDDLSRIRKGHGAHNMAIVRHFAINLVRAVRDKRSLKARRKRAAFSIQYLEQILGSLAN